MYRPDIPKEALEREYLRNKRSIRGTARFFATDHLYIKHLLKHHNIPLRSHVIKKEAEIGVYQQLKSIKHLLFPKKIPHS